MEAITTTKIHADWNTIAGILNGDYSHGVNRVILHGTPYVKTHDNNNTTWPGWHWGGGGVGVGQFTAWNHRQIWWEDARTISDYMSRNQAVMQNGTAKVDVALLNSTSSSFSILSGNSMQELLDNGYSYNILSEAVLKKSDNAVVSNGVLYEDGVAYKAIILKNADILSVSTLEQLIGFADAGLPIIIYEDEPSKVYGTQTSDNNDDDLKALVKTLKSKTNVSTVQTEAQVLRQLDSLGVQSAATYYESGLETSHRVDDVADYYYLYNSEEDRTVTVTLNGNGAPYFMDAWTGEITPVAEYTQNNGSVTVSFDLAALESKIIAVSNDQDKFGETADVHVTYAENGTALYSDGDIVYRSNTKGTHNVEFSDGTETEAVIDKSFSDIELQDGWSMTLRSFGPDATADNLDANGDLINPSAHYETILEFEDVELGAWTDKITLTAEDLAKLNEVAINTVNGWEDISGIALYSKEFDLPDDWTNEQGAYLTFTHDEEMVTKVTVNGNEIDRINVMTNTVDIGQYLEAGKTNKIEIKLDNTLHNRLSLDAGYVNSSWVSADRDTENGLRTVTLVPYTDVTLVEKTGAVDPGDPQNPDPQDPDPKDPDPQNPDPQDPDPKDPDPEDPKDSGDPSGTGTNNNNTDTPNTGDFSMISLILCGLIVLAGGIALLVRKRRMMD